MIEDRYRYATPRGIAALAGISESKAHAALILFKQRGRWIDLRDPAVRIYLERQQTRRIESVIFGRIFELCYPTGSADSYLIENRLNLPVLEAWRAASDLISIGLPAAPGYRVPAFLEDCVCSG